MLTQSARVGLAGVGVVLAVGAHQPLLLCLSLHNWRSRRGRRGFGAGHVLWFPANRSGCDLKLIPRPLATLARRALSWPQLSLNPAMPTLVTLPTFNPYGAHECSVLVCASRCTQSVQDTSRVGYSAPGAKTKNLAARLHSFSFPQRKSLITGEKKAEESASPHPNQCQRVEMSCNSDEIGGYLRSWRKTQWKS